MKGEEVEIILTKDGSHSLRNKKLDETYHSIHGAWQESVHVFIKNGLDYLLPFHHTQPVNILEVGFGTGLNTLLTLNKSKEIQPASIEYTSIEAFPLGEEIWSQLNYTDRTEVTDYYYEIHKTSWGHKRQLTPNFTLLKLHTSIQEVELEQGRYDLVYFDAFAPNKQPEMWDLSILKKINQAMARHSIFVTYCAKGQLKRDLRILGMKVETLAGPPGKKEMVRALKE